MSQYHTLLLFGTIALVFGGVSYVRSMVDGRSNVAAMLLTLGGGAALFAAEGAAPEGLSAGDIVPAAQELFTTIGRLVF